MSQQSPSGPQRFEQPTAYQDPYQPPAEQQYPGYQQGPYSQGPAYPQGPAGGYPGYPQPPQKPKKSIWGRWWMICLYVLVGLIIIGSISSGGSASKSDDAGHGTNTPGASAAADKKDSTAAKFGQAYSYDDGLSITVSAPTKFQPSEYAADDNKFKEYVKFEVRVVNKTGKTWDPGLFTSTVQSSNQEGDEVFDSERGLEGSPETKLLNGREVTFTVGYGVADPSDIVMEVSPDMLDHDSVMFQS